MRRRWLAAVTCVLVLVACAVLGAWLVLRSDDSTLAGNPIRSHDPIVAPAVETSRATIAVLPFRGVANEPDGERIADGLTRDVVRSLGRFAGLTVTPWDAAAPYRGATPPADAARALAVRYRVEGEVRYSRDLTLVDARLVDEQGLVLWSSRFEESPADASALPDRITREIAHALGIAAATSG